MKFSLSLVLFLVTFAVSASTTELNNQFALALNHFENELGKTNENITLSINSKECLRTGYDPALNAVVFCPNKNVINSGLDSIDVINHELFHAFICNLKPQTCSDIKKNEFIHEALADYFSYQLNPDENFGENFYLNRGYIRKYNTTWRIGLVQGAHQKGNALVSKFIQKKVSMKEAVELLETNSFEDEVSDSVEGIAYSKLSRYRLELNQEIKISFQFNKDAQVARVVWKLPSEFEVNEINDTTAAIKLIKPISMVEADAFFYSQDGVELGFQHYYFGMKLH